MAEANSTRVCVQCGEQFIVLDSSSRVYCSSRCVGTSKVKDRSKTFRTRNCLDCNKQFSYPIARGTDRVFCSSACAARNSSRHRKARLEREAGECNSPWCNAIATRKGSGQCERCYYSARRNGGQAKAPYTRNAVSVHTAGYVQIRKPEHPLSNKYGMVYEHRLACYERHGGVCPACYWCGVSIDWEVCHVDHLNDLKDDNRTDNLVVTCNGCNRLRGAIPNFMRRISPDRVNHFLQVTVYAHLSKAA